MAILGSELTFVTENQAGMLEKVLAPLKEAGINILAMSAWGEGDKAQFLIVTDDNEKAKQALQQAGFEPKQNEAVFIELENQPGTLAEAAKKIADAGVNINYCYFSATGPSAIAIFSSKDNAKLVSVLGD